MATTGVGTGWSWDEGSSRTVQFSSFTVARFGRSRHVACCCCTDGLLGRPVRIPEVQRPAPAGLWAGKVCGAALRQGGWGVSIDSIIAGPAAHVRLYCSNEPSSPGRWLLPGQVIQDLPALKIRDDVDSVQIQPGPPVEGEAGYQAYLIAAGQAQTHD